MNKPKIVNLIELDGKEVLIETLSEQQRIEIAITLHDNCMLPIGYIRKTA